MIASTGNSSQLRFFDMRDAAGTDWTTTATRIQKRTDVTNQAYIQFNGADLNYGIELGSQSKKFITS